MPVCHIQIAKLNIRLSASDARLFQAATAVFHPCLQQETAVADITITLLSTQSIPKLDHIDYQDQAIGFDLQKESSRFRFHFQLGAYFEINLKEFTITGVLQPSSHLFLEDMLYICLAPLLRRKGTYLIHGFAAQKEDQNILLVGPSGSGKTTAGMALLKNGWRFLANDVILLKGNPTRIYPTFDRIRVRKGTSRLLCEGDSGLEDISIIFGQLGHVTAVYFTQLQPNHPTQLCPLPAPLACAKLIESSVDRWDTAQLPAHLSFLRQLCEETAVFTLHSGKNIHTLSEMIKQ